MKPIRCIVIAFLVVNGISIQALWSQVRENPLDRSNPIGTSNLIDTTESGIQPLDTAVAMAYVLIGDYSSVRTERDSFLWKDTRLNPLPFTYEFLGNYGSATRSFLPLIISNPGFQTGWDQFDPYYVSVDSFRYYHQNIPVVKAGFSQRAQEDIDFDLVFGRSFARGLSLSIDYRRINQAGNTTPSWKFNNQKQRNTGFGIGVWHDAPNGRYEAFYNFISNAAVGQDNGGIAQPEIIDKDFPNVEVPVFRSNAETEHKHRKFVTRQIIHLLGDTASFGMDLWMQAQYGTSLYRFSDADTSGAQSYYQNFFTDPRGIRQFTFLKETQLTGGVSLPWKAARSTVHSSLRYRNINLEQEPSDRKLQELFFDAGAEFQWVEPLKLKGTLSFGLGQARGTYSFKAEGFLNTKVAGLLVGYYSILKRHPYTIESRLYVSQQLVYNSSFSDPLYQEFGVGWNWPKQMLQAGIKWFVFDEFIYFGEDKLPHQISGTFSLRQFYAKKTFEIKGFGAHGHIVWQPDVRREMIMPELMYQAGVYGRLKLFKRRLTFMPGIDITYYDEMPGHSYFPLTGKYHLTDGANIPDYFRVDAVAAIKINFLKAFVRVDDLAGLRENRVIYTSDFYPNYPGYLRIGLSTEFFN